jgi:hypothetical protein
MRESIGLSGYPGSGKISLSDARTRRIVTPDWGRTMKSNTPDRDAAVLSCWKEIAQYLGKGVRTVQRWEREFGLPVRRPKGIQCKSAVLADPQDLDVWLRSNWSQRAATRRDFRSVQVNPLIERSRSLRLAHGQLISETSAALAALVDSFRQFEALRGENQGLLNHAIMIRGTDLRAEPTQLATGQVELRSV